MASESRSNAPPPRLGDRRYRRALTAGIGVVLLQQFTGQPSVLYYAGAIFDAAGVGAVASVAVGVFKLVATLGRCRDGRQLWKAQVAVRRHRPHDRRVAGSGDCVSRLRGEGSGFTPRKVTIIGLIFLYIAAYQIRADRRGS